MKRLIAVLALCVLVGCASDGTKLRKAAYTSFGTYVLAEEAAADVVEDKQVPAEVVVKIQNTVRVAAPVAEAMYKDLVRFAQMQDELKGIQDAGGEPSEQKLAALTSAYNALRDSYAQSGDAIAALVELVKEYRHGD